MKKKVFNCLNIVSIFISIIISIIISLFCYDSFNWFSFIYLSIGLIMTSNIILTYVKKDFKTNIIKVLFSILFTIYSGIVYKEINIIIFGLLDISIIVYISNIVISKNKLIGNIVSNLLYLLYNGNVCVYLFGSELVNRIMLTNLDSLNQLSGNAFKYAVGVLLVLVMSLYPIKNRNKNNKQSIILLFVTIIVSTGLIFMFKENKNYKNFSPIGDYYKLVSDSIEYQTIKNKNSNIDLDKIVFYQEDIDNYYIKDNELVDKPNIILIFTEGLSYSPIFDSRNIMPNLKNFSKNSINFINYYNHTAATFRGIIGQLYSGFQFDNYDENHLISMQSILKKQGYYTEFINIDPNSGNWNDYLKSFNFDKIYVDKNRAFEGMAYSHSDKQAYEELYEQANYLNQKGQPFFLSIYTMGTHVSFDSVNEKFKDGKNNVLNRLYDCDYQFGQFIDKFNNSELVNNTIIVFTTDHASYVDQDYTKTFKKKRKSTFMDTVPLFIYYKGIKPRTIDVNGRTSIDFAPTILDFLDITDENYFLGTSLFGREDGSIYNRMFYEGTRFYKTENTKIIQTDRMEDREIIDGIYNYFGIAKK